MPRGRSAVSVNSDSSEMDADGIEAELSKLQRQLRIMEGDRQAYGIETQEVVRRQLSEIEKLTQEHEELQKDLRLSASNMNRQRDQENKQTLRSMLEYMDDLDRQLQEEKATSTDLDQEIRIWEKKVREQKKEMGGSHGTTYANGQLQKTRQTLENRLDKALVRMNKHLTKNCALRMELDTLRTERSRFEQLFRKLEKEKQDIHKEIGCVIDTSTSAYDERVEAQSKIVLLREKALKDQSQHNAEIKELERIIDHDRRLKDFMRVKLQERADEDVFGTQWLGGMEMADGRRQDQREDTVETYEDAFQRIHTITGEKDLDILVRKFIEVEDRNFALFNYVNEQNSEIERLQEQIEEIQKEMALFRNQGSRQEEHHQVSLREIELKIAQAAQQAERYEQREKEIEKIQEQLRKGIGSLFDKTGCDRSVIEDMLGNSSGIRNSNMMTYLGLLEQRANELLSAHSYLYSKDYDTKYSPREAAQFLLGQSPEHLVDSLFIQPPSTGEDYDTEDSPPTDEEERPLTQAELRDRILKGVLKKEERAMALHGTREVRMSKTDITASLKRRSQEA
ncbi:coiled-coil domain-containing protein 114 [Polypterus senegalus]|uniref:coiled-coil domain-containing protein 114 n=1 Tax=Polypterus senegalus TaxID=55291 RepID=UPI00196500D8|nr:coiled-coil domain-containing protein 114 [Polypterus senegalus]